MSWFMTWELAQALRDFCAFSFRSVGGYGRCRTYDVLFVGFAVAVV